MYGKKEIQEGVWWNHLEWWPDLLCTEPTYPAPRHLLAKSPTLRAMPWLASHFSASGPIGL